MFLDNKLNLNTQQRMEVEKYQAVYQVPGYCMGDARKACAEDNLRSVAGECGTYLDVGCGRAEMLSFASELGYVALGVEAVAYLTNDADIVQGVAWDLPFDDGAFDLVTLFDVIEHILPEDAERTLRELRRVAKKQLFITAANYSSRSMGVELHVNRLQYRQWDALLRGVFNGDRVEWLPRNHGIQSETWQIYRSE